MGGCMSVTEHTDEGRMRSQSIDRGLEADARRRKECKILLLGAGESGKSTIVKQMKILHQNGYSEEELKSYRMPIYSNLLECGQTLAEAMRRFEVKPASARVYKEMDYLLKYQLSADPSDPISPAVGEAMTVLWNDPSVPNVVSRQNEFYFMDSVAYFFKHASRITAPGYLPNNDDILRARIKTTGIHDTRFQMKQLSIHMFDVGGQRSERRKWIHCFENVTAIIFCVALNEFDQVLLEDKERVRNQRRRRLDPEIIYQLTRSQNRLLESLDLFGSVINSRWFMRTGIILFLNKIDLFPAALERSRLSDYFDEYTGANVPEPAAKFILWRFTVENRAHLTIYPQYDFKSVHTIEELEG
ncbi:hypothetical protein KEM56_002974 [Ascosphaera pollenicola]|nr:hypothetical protein KEM56_002974 [Ascosphaera pollenicola]